MFTNLKIAYIRDYESLKNTKPDENTSKIINEFVVKWDDLLKMKGIPTYKIINNSNTLVHSISGVMTFLEHCQIICYKSIDYNDLLLEEKIKKHIFESKIQSLSILHDSFQVIQPTEYIEWLEFAKNMVNLD